MKSTEPQLGNLDRRAPSDKSVRLAWRDEHGQIRCLSGRCIDVSSRRIHIEVSEQIPLHTHVKLRAHRANIGGSTSVKYVTRCNSKFILVLDQDD